MTRIQIAGRTYTEQDIREGHHYADPNVDPDAEPHGVVNVVDSEVIAIQAGFVRGEITFD